jgi:hypothetical protein
MTEAAKTSQDIRDLYFHFGVEIPRRFSRREKDFYLNACAMPFHELGLTCRSDRRKVKHTIGNNLVIGNYRDADVILVANYDTPARCFGKPYPYYPCHGPATAKQSGRSQYAPVMAGMIISFLLIALFWGQLDFRTRPAATIAFIAALLGANVIPYLMSFGTASPLNLNRNSSGVVGLIRTAQLLTPQALKHVCFVLTDYGCSRHTGDYLLRQAIPGLDQKTVMLYDCIASGRHLTIAARGKSGNLADKLRSSLSGSTIVHPADTDLPYTQFSFYPCGILITTGEKDSTGVYTANTATGKDQDIDPHMTERICRGVADVLNQRWPH